MKLLITACLLALAAEVIADDVPNPASLGIDPTRAQKPVSEPRMLEPPTARDKFDLPPLEKAQALPAGGESILIRRISFRGNSVFSQQQLEVAVSEFLHRQIQAADIESIRRKVSEYYNAHGYINSGAVLESQSLADGELKLTIIEGRLVEVRQTGQERLPESYIQERLIAGSGQPLNVEELQDSYRLLLGDPMIKQLNGQLLPGKRLGESILDVRVTRARPYQLSFTADDYQTPSVGGYAGRISGWVDNLLAMGERMNAQFITTAGSLGYNMGIDLPVTARDTRVSFRYSDMTSSLLESSVKTLGITNHVVGFDAGLTQPVYRTFADEFSLGLNFVVRQNRTLFKNACGLSPEALKGCETQATVLRMAQNFSHRGEGNSLVFVSTFNAGLDALGATKNSSDLADGQFFSWLGQSMYSQRLLDDGTHLVVKANIQLADTPVLSLERYSIGGVYTVRGYRENTYVRDNGFNTSVELHYPIYNADTEQKNNLNLVPFWDYGGAWNNRNRDLLTGQPTNYLFSAGIGFNWQYHQLSTDFYWAHAFTPVANQVVSEHHIQDDGIHFRVNVDAF